MTTGPEHYAEAEQLLEDARNADPDADRADVELLLRFAQVHATLGHTAATALQTVLEAERAGTDSRAAQAWRGALTHQTPPADTVEIRNGLGDHVRTVTAFDDRRASEVTS